VSSILVYLLYMPPPTLAKVLSQIWGERGPSSGTGQLSLVDVFVEFWGAMFAEYQKRLSQCLLGLFILASVL